MGLFMPWFGDFMIFHNELIFSSRSWINKNSIPNQFWTEYNFCILSFIRFGSNVILKWNDLGKNRTRAEFPGTHYVYAGYIAGFDKRLCWFFNILST